MVSIMTSLSLKIDNMSVSTMVASPLNKIFIKNLTKTTKLVHVDFQLPGMTDIVFKARKTLKVRSTERFPINSIDIVE